MDIRQTHGRIMQESFDGTTVICIQVASKFLVLPVVEYEQALARGRAYKAWDIERQVLTQAAREDERRQQDLLDRTRPGGVP